jgi:hypothetical protein
MQQQIFLVLAMLALMANDSGSGYVPFEGTPIEQFETPSRYFDETGHNVWGTFLAFYEAHGGEAAFGQPLTEPINEAGIQVQYFEHARFELHPDAPDQVHLTHLGRLISQERMHEPAFAPQEPGNPATSAYFAETGHNISHHFLNYWRQHGGLAVFGYPVSAAFIEHRGNQRKPYMVQYFERTRLEYHLAHPGAPVYIRSAPLGREYVLHRRIPTRMLVASRPVVPLSTSVMSFQPSPAELTNVIQAAQVFNGMRVMPGEQVSFLATLGEISSDTGYVPGAAIVGNGIGLEMGGGICYVSTLLYRGVLAAGLENIERHQHTLALEDFNDIPGLDSAVYTSSADGSNRTPNDLDLRWRNNMHDPILLTTEVAATGTMTMTIWGYDDGRITELRDPTYITQDQEMGPPIWLADASMPTCEVRHLKGNPGMEVRRERVVWDANGSQLSTDPIISRYHGSRDVFLYGPGIDVVVAQYHSPEEARQLCLQAQQSAPHQAPAPEAPARQPAPPPSSTGGQSQQAEPSGTALDQVRQATDPTPTAAPAQPAPPQPHNGDVIDQLHSVVEQRGEVLVEEPPATPADGTLR